MGISISGDGGTSDGLLRPWAATTAACSKNINSHEENCGIPRYKTIFRLSCCWLARIAAGDFQFEIEQIECELVFLFLGFTPQLEPIKLLFLKKTNMMPSGLQLHIQ